MINLKITLLRDARLSMRQKCHQIKKKFLVKF